MKGELDPLQRSLQLSGEARAEIGKMEAKGFAVRLEIPQGRPHARTG